jgi:hypothetical protein
VVDAETLTGCFEVLDSGAHLAFGGAGADDDAAGDGAVIGDIEDEDILASIVDQRSGGGGGEGAGAFAVEHAGFNRGGSP